LEDPILSSLAQRVVLCPAHAGRNPNGREHRRLFAHDRDPPGVRRLIISKAAGQIARLQEVVDPSLEHVIIEPVLPVRPVPQELAM
jgi:hypothetical protein